MPFLFINSESQYNLLHIISGIYVIYNTHSYEIFAFEIYK